MLGELSHGGKGLGDRRSHEDRGAAGAVINRLTEAGTTPFSLGSGGVCELITQRLLGRVSTTPRARLVVRSARNG
jgi:hypothetical protein